VKPSNVHTQALELGAIELRRYASYHNCFTFYILGCQRPDGYYPIFRYIPCLNGVGRWQETLGAAEWVDQSEVLELSAGGTE
jgi:hypothetical protein